jgi:uncharacterized protein (DUF1778 family)
MPSTSRIDLRLTDEQKKTIQHKAESLGMDISGYIKFVALNTEIKCEITSKEIEKAAK